MAKRTRGTGRTNQGRIAGRPAAAPGRPAAARPSRAAAPSTPRGGPSQLEAAVEIADDVAADRPAAAGRELERTARSTPARARTRPGNLLAAKAATEYLYVSQDIRRIVLVSAALFAVMLALWVLIVVLRVITV